MPLNDVGDRARLRDPDQLVNPDPGLPVRPDLAEEDVEYVTLTNYSKGRARVEMVVYPGMEVRVPRGTEFGLLAFGFRENAEKEAPPEGKDADLSGSEVTVVAATPGTTQADREARSEAAQKRGERLKGKRPPHNPATAHLQAAEDAMAEGAVPGESTDVEGASEASTRPGAPKPAKAGGERTDAAPPSGLPKS